MIYSRPSTFRSTLLPAILILLLALELRLLGMMRLPLFIDEALHLSRTHAMLGGDLYVGSIRKWLYPVTLIPFRPLGLDGPWLARAISTIVGVFGTGGVIALGSSLHSRRAGLLAGLIYAVLPLAVFHERQALADPLLAALTTLSLLLIVWQSRKPRLGTGILLGGVLAAACLIKLSAVLFLGMPIVGLLIWSGTRSDRWQRVTFALLSILLALALIALAYNTYLTQNHLTETPAETMVGGLRTLAGVEKPDSASTLRGDLRVIAEVALRYFGLPLIVLAISSLVLITRGMHDRMLIYLAVPALVFIIPAIIAKSPSEYFSPRYLMVNATPLVVLAGISLITWHDSLSLHPLPATQWLEPAGLLLIIIPSLWFDIRLSIDPSDAGLVSVDRLQYITGNSSGAGMEPLARDLNTLAQESGSPIGVLAYSTTPWLDAYLGSSAEVLRSRAGDADVRNALVRWLENGWPVYLVDEPSGEVRPVAPGNAQVISLGDYETNVGELRLQQITSIEGRLVAQLLADLTPDPTAMGDEYAALGVNLSAENNAGPVLIYPPTHAGMIAAHTSRPIIPLEINQWPIDQASIAAILNDVDFSEGPILVDVILINEAAVDPSRAILLTFQQHEYWQGDAWYDVMHQITYVSGPQSPTLAPLNAQYEGAITLKAVAILDPVVDPGSPVRVSLQWSTPTPIRNSFKVFIHITDYTGQPVAQIDSIPGAGLFPMTSWEPGKSVDDRYAISLPADIQPGVYGVWVGIYQPESGLRLPVIEGTDAGSDRVGLGNITVQPSP